MELVMSIYTPLQSYLADHPEASVVLSYEEIERLLGRSLPPTAYGDNKRQWWANTETHSQALAWLRARRKAKLDVNRNRVTFIHDLEAGKDADTQAFLKLAMLEPSARRMLEDVAEEQGTTLTEAAALMLNQAARRRRQATLDWFAANTTPSGVTSAELIRADRDAR